MIKILIADDEPIERQVVSKKITRFFPDQFEIFLAENGIEALKIYDQEHCPVCLLDISMPGMTGLEVAEAIREESAETSIIFLTAFDEFSFAKKAIEVKALDYILKPGADEDLQNALEEAISIAGEAEHRDISEVVHGTSSGGSNEGLSEDIGETGDIAFKARTYIDEHYKEDLSLQDVAGYLGYSDVYFCKMFKQNIGKSFIVYLNELRIEKAKKLLSRPEINIKDISAEAGFRDANYFTRVFKRMVGMTPSEYRNGVI